MKISEMIPFYLQRGRYLAAMPDSALTERQIHLLNNIVGLGESGKVSLDVVENSEMAQKFFDVICEFILRHGDVHKGQVKGLWQPDKNVMVKPSEDVAHKVAILSEHVKKFPSDELIRFSSSFEYMEELVDRGGLLLQPASSFKDAENLSVCDDELRVLLRRYLSEKEKAELIPMLGVLDKDFLDICVEAKDFLVLCFARGVNYRMISDWQAEAAVIIHDPVEFEKRLSDATVHLRSVEGSRLEAGNVDYLDPYYTSPKEHGGWDLAFCKPVRFAFQKEFRYVIRQAQEYSFEQRKVFLGPLDDIASLIDLRLTSP